MAVVKPEFKLGDRIIMAAILNRDTKTVRPAREDQVPHWRQVARFSTVEKAEATLAELKSHGVDAVLSMIDGLCVLARNEA